MNELAIWFALSVLVLAGLIAYLFVMFYGDD